MSFLYYQSIYGKPNIAQALMYASQENYKLFDNYLTLAIESQKERVVSARWEPINDGKEVRFTPKFAVVELDIKQTLTFKMPENWYEVIKNQDFDTGQQLIFTQSQKFIQSSEVNVKTSDDGKLFVQLNFVPQPNEPVIWGTAQVTLKLVQITKQSLTFNQGGKLVHVEIVSPDPDSNIYRASVLSAINPQLPLVLNGLQLTEWELSSNEQISITEGSNDQQLEILYQKGNLFYLNTPMNVIHTLKVNGVEVPYKRVQAPIPESVFYQGNSMTIYQEEKGYRVYDLPDTTFEEITVVDSVNPELLYTVNIKAEAKDNTSLWLELIDEEDDGSDGSYSTFSKLDYFFEDGVSELEDNPKIPIRQRQRFAIKRRYREERKIQIAFKGRPRNISYDDLPEQLYVAVNTYQLDKQKEAIEMLRTKPLMEHKKLLALAERQDLHRSPWGNFAPQEISEWQVLKDVTREGTEKQRSFVKKALATPDFVLLEGPPGSGKTTAIIELILQLIQKGKRILLSASTHVAIDNVLERLKEQGLMDDILPLRIGDDSNMSDSVKEYSINNLNSSSYKELAIDAANLVCGTTIGILQHPIFKNQKGHGEPNVPYYDYLIIDESSKTTFQEFLIPALYAERWILVGDVKQLSPYTDRDHLVANFNSFVNPNGTNEFDRNAQKAVLLLFRYVYQNPREKTKFCIVEVDEVVEAIKREMVTRHTKYPEMKLASQVTFLEANVEPDSCNDLFTVVTKRDCDIGMPLSWALPASDVLFIKQSELEQMKKYIPANMIVLNRSDWEQEGQHFQMEAFYDRPSNHLAYRERPSAKPLTNPKSIIDLNNEFLSTKTWAEELVWRMVRVYELRDSNKDTMNFTRDIKHLTPSTSEDQVEAKYQVVKDIALPSILESLKDGVGTKKDDAKATVLNSGFEDHVLSYRYERLDYQHRMHPDISVFPRSVFYNDAALKDSMRLERKWSYQRYPSRNIWVNVDGNTRRNYNVDEAKRLIEELKHFVEWAEKNPKSDGTPWTVACLTFYRGQETRIKELLRKYTGLNNKHSQFKRSGVEIVLYTVDKFQGREADVTFLSMVQTFKDGFLDNPNRLNVAVTRARYQRVVIGKYEYFLHRSRSDQLRLLARESNKMN